MAYARHLPKTDVEKNETANRPDEKSHGLGIQRESCKKKCPIIYLFSDDFAQVKEPRHSENKMAKKRYTSIVSRPRSGYPVLGAPCDNTMKIMQKTVVLFFFSDDFGLRSAVIQKTKWPKKGIPLS